MLWSLALTEIRRLALFILRAGALLGAFCVIFAIFAFLI